MEPMWYYAHNGKQAGPISEPEVREMVNRGDLRGSDLVWKKGSPDWVEIRSIPGLLPDLEELPIEGTPLPPPRRERSEARERYREDRDRDQDRYRDDRDR